MDFKRLFWKMIYKLEDAEEMQFKTMQIWDCVNKLKKYKKSIDKLN